jgi:DNA-binding LacI/PurR family transcriptional regulator
MQQIKIQPGFAKYRQVKSQLCDYLTLTGIKPGDKLWTEAELTKKLGVSVNTIRKALDEMVREGILVRQAGKGTFLNKLNGSSVESRTVLFLSLRTLSWMRNDVFYGEVINGLEEELDKADFCLCSFTRAWDQGSLMMPDIIRRHDPAAIVMFAGGVDIKPQILALKTLNVPILLLNRYFDNFFGAQVYFDDCSGGAMAAEYLLGKGHRHVGVLAGPPKSPASIDRLRGFREVMTQAGIPISPDMIVAGDWDEMHGYLSVERILRRVHRPTAVFCCSDLLAYGAIKRCEKLGLRVPEDVAIIGFGGFKMSRLHYPSLTTIKMDLPLMGQRVGIWLMDAVHQCQATGKYEEGYEEKLPVNLVVGTTA